MHIPSTRWVAASAAMAGLMAATMSLAVRAQSRPFTPEVDEFVRIYLKNGGDKLTNWVQGDATSSPDAELRAFKPIAGLSVELVAAEPVIRQPIDLHFDDRGRLWVVQYLQYPFPAGLTITSYDQYLRARYSTVPAAPPNHVRGADKITVLEDKNADGTFDSHRDVISGLNITTSVVTGHGGIWVMNPPYLLFYRDRDSDAVPDGDPEVRLAGFGLEDTHSLANSLTWGPDGWLYGVHGSTSTAQVRGISFLGQAVWRYHPEADRFELFAQGGGNPWTLSFDSKGRAFSGDNGGNSRGFHWVEGGRYEKNWPKHGPVTRPFSFGFIPHMDHAGYAARFAMTGVIYEDGKLPGYEGQLLSGMALTSRMQATRLVADGSTFRTVDTDALLTTADRTFRPVDTAVGPDGALYIADWCDIRMDHTDPRDTWDKSCGRIWRLRAIESRPAPRVNLAGLSGQELVQLLGDQRKWYREHARRLLGEHQDRSLVPQLRQLVRERRGAPALEALWAANLIAPIDPGWVSELLAHPDVAVRAWAVRLFKPDASTAPSMRDMLVRLARTEPDAEVRSELANTTARLSTSDALAVLGALADREEDVSDRHIPLRIWWALEHHFSNEPDVVLTWVEKSGVWHAPVFTQHIAGRLARRLAAERGPRQSFTRNDPDGNWKAYAEHPRTLMPGGKGDYTDWQSDETPEVRENNLRRLARLMQSAPSAADRDRLLAGARAADTARPAATAVDGESGKDAFLTYCAPCHQADGNGMERLAAPLRHSKWVLGSEDLLARIVLNGLKGELLMPAMGTLGDQQLAAILTYIRSAWGHDAAPVSPETVARIRAASTGRQTPWTAAELSGLGR